MSIKLLFRVMLLSSILFNPAAYAVALGIYPLENLNFGSLTPLIGRCQMDPTTGVVTNLVGNLCANVGNTSRGFYRIVAEKNTLMRVTVNYRLDSGDGFSFIPEGKITSSEWQSTISAGSFIDIDSGPTGWIDINVGGQLIFNSPPTPGSSYSIDFDIEYIPSP